MSLAAWLPSASDIFQSLKALGYQQLPCPSGQPTAVTEGQSEDPPAHSGSCRHLNVSLLLQTLESLLSETNAAGFFSDPVSVRQTVCHRSPRRGLLLNACLPSLFSHSLERPVPHKQADAVQLLVALHRMRLDPAVASTMLPELSRAGELLVEAWEDAASSVDPHGSCRADVAEQLAALGPTHRAALRALDCPGAAAFTQAAALALLRQLVKVWKRTGFLGSGSLGMFPQGEFHDFPSRIKLPPLPPFSAIFSCRFRLLARLSLGPGTARLSS